MPETAQFSRVKATKAAVATKSANRQTAGVAIANLSKLNEADQLAALKTAVTALGTALLSDTR